MSGKILRPNLCHSRVSIIFVLIYLNKSNLCFTEKDADIQPEVGEGGGIVEGTYTVKLNENQNIRWTIFILQVEQFLGGFYGFKMALA